jgi:hypothetical protein
MSEPKFTKGPWRVLDNTSYTDRPNHYQILTKDAGLWVAYTECCDNEEEEANAALIAAAPEMYELLQDIATNYQCMPNPCGVEQRIEAVLKKARGEK